MPPPPPRHTWLVSRAMRYERRRRPHRACCRWDRSLPRGVEAFFFDGRPELLEPMRRVRAAFLAAYGLAADEVPLLEYACAKLQPAEIRPGARCWVEVS